MKLKKVSEQVIVITGATSGIGLTTARMAARKGAKLVLVARNEDALRQLADEINSTGSRAVYAAADVADENALRRAADVSINEYGRFDTWVNNAGCTIYGRITEVPVADMRRLFETNFWGFVYGSRIAVEHLSERGGALINVGSEVCDIAVPLQGIYTATKHAIKGFTDVLRIEVEADQLPVSVSLIKPTAIHTPIPQNARSYLRYEPHLPPPIYAPELVAEAILHCAENSVRDFMVGDTVPIHTAIGTYTPRLYDRINELIIDSVQNSGQPAQPDRPDGLYQTNSKLEERGSDDRLVLEDSLYQHYKIHPLLTAGIIAGSGLAIAGLLRSRRNSAQRNSLPAESTG
jgi:short-subunit dehydrogenase